MLQSIIICIYSVPGNCYQYFLTNLQKQNSEMFSRNRTPRTAFNLDSSIKVVLLELIGGLLI